MIAAPLAFVAACVAVMLIPGPNVALIVATSVAHGRRAGLVAVAGTCVAIVLQLMVLVAGVAGLLALSPRAAVALRWAGAAYLVWLGMRQWRLGVTAIGGGAGPAPGAWAVFGRAFGIELINPKIVLFYAAVVPHFLRAGAPAVPQLGAVSVVIVTVAIVMDSLWALGAGVAGRLLAARAHGVVSGGVLVCAGLALAAINLR